LVLECIPRQLAAEVTAALDIPVIGIGAGPECDGQVLVIYDMLGINPHKPPSFVADFMAETGSVTAALEAYVGAVRSVSFPSEQHCFS
jgi:3-methyl-2-oxobutanoate hydroxymethyltransferase